MRGRRESGRSRNHDGAVRVAVVNDYPLYLAAAGLYPRQHLWGVDVLAAQGFAVDVVQPTQASRLNTWTQGRFGDLPAQGQLLRLLRSVDVVYAPAPQPVRALSQARALRARVPVLQVQHHPPVSRLECRALHHVERIMTISSAVRRAILDLGVPARRVDVLEWGPDAGWNGYGRADAGAGGVVLSTGRSGRDYDTLLAAVRELPHIPLVVHLPQPRPDLPAWVEPRYPRPDGQVLYSDLEADFERAAVAAIPLHPTPRLAGLTELGDAMAMGVPIVMTRTPWIDVDIERVGCGVVLAPGDVDGWRQALRTLMADPAMRAEMGAAGRGYVASGHSSAEFGSAIASVLRATVR